MSPGLLVALLVFGFLGAATGGPTLCDLAGRILDTSEAGIPAAVITASTRTPASAGPRNPN